MSEFKPVLESIAKRKDRHNVYASRIWAAANAIAHLPGDPSARWASLFRAEVVCGSPLRIVF